MNMHHLVHMTLDFSLFQNVIPAQAEIQKFFLSPSWIPACAGMTWVERYW
jgi:hypothetical protein